MSNQPLNQKLFRVYPDAPITRRLTRHVVALGDGPTIYLARTLEEAFGWIWDKGEDVAEVWLGDAPHEVRASPSQPSTADANQPSLWLEEELPRRRQHEPGRL